MFILVVFSIFMLGGCSAKTENTITNTSSPISKPIQQETVTQIIAPETDEQVEELPTIENRIPDVEMDKFSLLSESFPPEIDVEYWDNIPVLLYSKTNNAAFENVFVGDSRAKMESIMDKKYDKFYSIHDPENPNIGWYVLNENYDIVIFDFDLDDGSFLNEPISENAEIKQIVVSNLKYFD